MRNARRCRSGWPCGSKPEVRDLRAREQRRGRVRTRRDTGSAADAGRRIHGPVGVFFRNQNRVAIRSAARRRADIAARSNDAIERAAVHHQILDQRERLGAPRLDKQLLAIFEMPQSQLADRGSGQRPMRHAVDHEAARSADPFAAIVLERDRLLALRRSVLRSTHRALPASTCPRSDCSPRSGPFARAAPGFSAARYGGSASSIYSSAGSDARTQTSSGSLCSIGGASTALIIPRRRHTKNPHRCAALRPPASDTLRGSGRRTIRCDASASMAHQFRQLEEVRHAPGLFERLVQFVAAAQNVHVLPVFLAQLANLLDRALQALAPSAPSRTNPT